MLADIFAYAVFAYAGFWALMGAAWLYEKTFCAAQDARKRLRPEPPRVKPERMRIPRRVDLRDEEKVEVWLHRHLSEG